MSYSLSIIIPHYNNWEKLIRAINSIPMGEDIQIIVVDDKSDGCIEQLEILRKEYPSVEFYENKSKYKGAGQARNIGLENAQGEWLCFLDSDDYLLDGFKKVFDAISSSDNIDIVYCPPTSFVENTGKISTRHQRYENLVKEYVNRKSEENELKLRFLFVSPCSKFIRRQLITDNSILFDLVLYSNDVMFSTKSGYCARKVVAMLETFYCISDADGSLTKISTSKSKNTILKIEQKRYRYLKKHLSRMQMNKLGYSTLTGLYFWALRLGMDREKLSCVYKRIVMMFNR